MVQARWWLSVLIAFGITSCGTSTEIPTVAEDPWAVPEEPVDEPDAGPDIRDLPPCGNGGTCNPNNLGGETCQGLGMGEGILACDAVTCTYDTSMCEGTTVGNGGNGSVGVGNGNGNMGGANGGGTGGSGADSGNTPQLFGGNFFGGGADGGFPFFGGSFFGGGNGEGDQDGNGNNSGDGDGDGDNTGDGDNAGDGDDGSEDPMDAGVGLDASI